jgi:hypothetical protein
MSILKDAKQNLEDHGVEVEIAETVESHNTVNSKSELFSAFGVQDGLEAATYSHLDDRMDVYKPLAVTKVVNELEEEDFEKVSEAFDRNKDAFSSELRKINSVGVEESFSDQVKLSKMHYLAAINDDEVEEGLKQDLKDSLRDHLLFSSEHELVHASHYQKILEDDVESLDEDFRRYVRDIRNINQELDDFEERTMNEGISDLIDIEMAAAMNFLDEDRLQNIVRIAGREHHKWKSEYESKMEEYIEEKREVEKTITEDKNFEVWSAFNEISELANYRMYDLDDFNGIDDAVEQMENEGVEEYQTLVQAGVSKQELKETLKQLREFEEENKQELREPRKYEKQVIELLEDAIVREAELQGNFSEFMQQYADRMVNGAALPGDFTEAYAQFWTAYREGDLESDRENIFQSLEGYDIEGLEDTMEDLLGIYDNLEGSQEERVTQVMSSQMEYLENNYDLDPES